MAKSSRQDLQAVVLLVGAAIMTLLSIRKLPPLRELVHLPATPFDNVNPETTDDFLLLQQAEKKIPTGESATLMTEPRDAARESSLFGLFVALLPGRRVLPAAQWNVFTPELAAQADYVIVVGRKPPAPLGTLVYSDSHGTIWRRDRR